MGSEATGSSALTRLAVNRRMSMLPIHATRYRPKAAASVAGRQQSRGALKLQAGVEGAINVLNSRSRLTVGGAPVILPAANIRLEEKRAEFF